MALVLRVLLHSVAGPAGVGHVLGEVDQTVVPVEGIVSTGGWTDGVVTVSQQALQVGGSDGVGLGPVTPRVSVGPWLLIVVVLLPDQISPISTLPVNVGGVGHVGTVAPGQGNLICLHAGWVRAHHV